MNRARKSIASIGIAVLFAACGSSGTPTPSQTGGSGGSTVTSSGGAAGSESGGSSGASNGGAGGTSNGGSGGDSGGNSGGSSGNQTGGSGGNAGGGSGGNAGGGSSGNASGGSTGPAAGGATASTGGKGGPAGGTTSTGAGGSAAGGTQGTGGSPSTGGATTPAGPAVYTSTNGSCVSGSGTTWTPGTIATSTANATVTVNDGTQSQTWEGFGGAFNEKGWQYLQMLSQSDRDRAMKLLFGTDGAHFAMGRIPMGASDFAVTRYTCDEGSADTSMANFNTTEDEKYIIPFIKAALAVRSDIKFWASPWTPPTWMKAAPFTAFTEPNSPTTTSHFDSGNMTDDASYLTAYAQYFVKFVNAYKAANINISVVAPQNAPNYALCYPSAIWTSALYTKFVGQYLGPALKDTGVGIMLGTLSNSDPGKDADLGNAALADATAKAFFTVAGVQWNVLDKVNGGTTFGGLPIWATEHKCGNYPWDPSGFPKHVSPAPNDQAYGVESWGYIRDAITKGKVTAYNAWNMVLDTVGLGNDNCRPWNQDALLTVDTSSKALNATSAYCVFRHFSQFVAVGAKRVATSGGDAVAFKNPDGHIVAVMYNSGSANSNYVVSIGGQKLQFSMPAQGWATVVN